MNIVGLIVHSHPHKIAHVKARLEVMRGVEVHAASDCGRLLVSVEEDNDGRMVDTILQMHNVDGVLSAAMIYHHYEECGSSQKEA
ncbi:MAG: chaperone NapD [Gammaproteobacteria bacterium]